MKALTRRAAPWLLGALAAWLLVYELNVVLDFAAFSGVLLGRPAHLAIDLGGTVLCFVGAARRRGGQRLAWVLIGAGVLAWTAGDIYWTTVLLDEESIPVPSLADAGYLLFPLLAFAGLAGLGRERTRGAAATVWFDALSAGLAVAAVSAAVVIPAVLDTLHGAEARAVATNLAYPVSDLILLGLVAGTAALRGWRLDRGLVLIAAGIVAFWVADTNYLLTVAGGSYTFPDPFDLGWSACFLALGAAALAPAQAARAAVYGQGRRTAVLPLAFAAAAVGVLVYAGLADTTPLAVALAGASLLAVGARLWLTFRDNVAMLASSQHEALTDALTSLGNRRALKQDLAALLPEADDERPLLLVLFDLDGFKHYNDCFGHPAGDDLLVRLGGSLARRVASEGRAYRMGGDEFCALLRPAGRTAAEAAADAAEALAERGEGFAIGASHGAVVLPLDTVEPDEALRLADQRMYAQKHGGRSSAGAQSRDVLLRALAERSPDLGHHLGTVAELAVAVGRRLGLDGRDLEQVRHAAELHDIGKVAIPDAILGKPGPLDDDEWTFMRRHTIIGERIVAAAPALRDVGPLVRASHERHDGQGYPDGLAGAEIPLGARIVAVCDAFDAMTTDRPYRGALPDAAALAELRACAGAQFDPAVVAAFCDAHAELLGSALADAA